MNIFKTASRKLIQKGEHAVARILSLASGLAFGIILLSEVLYYYSFDGFYPQSNRIYAVYENFKTDGSTDKLSSYPSTSGAIAPGLKAEVPGIEAATRLNRLGSSVFYTEEKKSYSADFSLADENVFDVLPRKIIVGKPKEILLNPMNCMVSDKIAHEIGGNIIGKMIELKEYPGKKITIAGVFKALPENTNYKYDILISMVSTSQFMWDGTQNWMGNDRYYTCVKLLPGVTPQSLMPAVRTMQEKHQDIIKLEQTQQGLVFKYSFNPIKKIYVDKAKDMILIISIIAFAVIFVSLLNYTLLTLNTLINKAKSAAVYKCCGANSSNLQKLIFQETMLIFAISLTGVFIIILLIKPIFEAQTGHLLSSAMNSQVIVPITILTIVLLFLTSYFPGRYFSRIPVAFAFKNIRQNKNKWKLGLLAFQFSGAAFILTVLVIVSLQYNKMQNTNHGYQAQNVYYCSVSGMESTKINSVIDELHAIPEIEKVGLGFCLPVEGASGNNVYSPDRTKQIFNVADFYWIDHNYLSILGIPVIDGQTFSSKYSVTNEILISKKGADMLKINNGWNDGVIGKPLEISEHEPSTIKGIFPDFVINSITNPDLRPSVFFYLPSNKFQELHEKYPSYSYMILVKSIPGSNIDIIKKLTGIFNIALPYNDASVQSLAEVQRSNYGKEKGFKNTLMAGNFIILVITLMGLIGYTNAEFSRRRKELAIRKISGAKLSNILVMFIKDLENIAIPSVLIGLLIAWFTAEKWMKNFSVKISLNWTIFISCSLIILMLIALVAIINYLRVSDNNPVEELRYE